MKVCDAMSRDVQVASPTQSIRNAAKIMAKIDVGVLPVGENDRLIGMITDRDITVRAVAEGKATTTKVRDIMSEEVLYCFEDQDLDEVARNMSVMKIRRLPVVNRSKRLVGDPFLRRSRPQRGSDDRRTGYFGDFRARWRAFAVDALGATR